MAQAYFVMHIVTFILNQWFSTWWSQRPWRSFAISVGVVRASDKKFIITSRFYISYMEPLFIVAKIIGSPGRNDSLLFHSKLFYVWWWPLQYCCVW